MLRLHPEICSLIAHADACQVEFHREFRLGFLEEAIRSYEMAMAASLAYHHYISHYLQLSLFTARRQYELFTKDEHQPESESYMQIMMHYKNPTRISERPLFADPTDHHYEEPSAKRHRANTQMNPGIL